MAAWVAIPVRNEAARIGLCLGALFRQTSDRPFGITLLLNNCTDGTEAIVAATRPPPHVTLGWRHVHLSPPVANAGTARAMAMEDAAGRAAVLLTTDADGTVPPDWLARNLAALRHADAVAGRAVIDPEEARAIPQALHDADALECELGDLQDEIASLIDPDAADPWPRHAENSGASLAVTAAAYRRAGGMAPVPSGEDRAFVAALRRIDARVRHAPEVWVRVSGRITGRAAGGMAETIARRMIRPDPFLDDRLEPMAAVLRRARLRRAARLYWTLRVGDVDVLAHRLRVPDAESLLAGHPTFGAAWEDIEHRSPVLARTAIPSARILLEISRARVVRDLLRREAVPAGSPALLTA